MKQNNELEYLGKAHVEITNPTFLNQKKLKATVTIEANIQIKEVGEDFVLTFLDKRLSTFIKNKVIGIKI